VLRRLRGAKFQAKPRTAETENHGALLPPPPPPPESAWLVAGAAAGSSTRVCQNSSCRARLVLGVSGTRLDRSTDPRLGIIIIIIIIIIVVVVVVDDIVVR
jgi:hypothetical protein